MAREVAVAVDLGASGGRVVSGTLTGGRLKVEDLHRFDNGPVAMGGELTWDLPRLWQEVLAGLRVAAGRHGRDAATVGVDAWGVDFALLASDDSLLGNPVCYRDHRTRGMLAVAETIVPRAEVFAATGLQFMEINSLYQLLALKRRRAAVLDVAARLLMIPDVFHWLLAGRCANEATNASTTQCFDPVAGDWAFGMLDRFGLPRRIFGPVSPPGACLGPLRPDVATATGLEAAQVVLPGTHDTASAVAAVPAAETPGGRPDWCYVSLGTWALVGAEIDRPLISPECLALNFTNEGGVGGTTRLLKNSCGLWLLQQCRAAWRRQGREWTWDQLAAMATEAVPLATLVDADHPTLLAPADMPEAIRALARATGEPVPESPAAVARAALESVAAGIGRRIRELDRLLGGGIGRVHVVGGGVRNRLLCQMIADATGRPVVAGPVEATAIGNLLVQLTAREGPIDLPAMREVVRRSFAAESFSPQATAAWDARVGR